MLDHFLEGAIVWLQWDIRVTIALVITSVFALTRLFTTFSRNVALAQKGDAKSPPMVPYSIPFLGNLLPFAFDTCSFLKKTRESFGPNVAFQLRVLNQKMYFLTGQENVLAYFKASRELSTVANIALIMQNAFGCPESAHEANTRDNTGVLSQPQPGSDPLEPHNRLMHLLHKSSVDNLTGAGLTELATRFMANLEVELEGLDVGDDWKSIPDFYAMLQKVLFTASTRAICGSKIFEQNPTISDDYWEFDKHMPTLFKSIPRFLVPKAFRARDTILASIKKWHGISSENCSLDVEENQKVEWEPYFGSKLVRDRMKGFTKIDGYNADAIAAQDLALIWAANANIVPLVCWMLLDTLTQPDLLSRTRHEVSDALSPSAGSKLRFDMPNLLSQPLLQSIYSEELRLRNAAILTRSPINHDQRIGSWVFPKDKMILLSSWHEHRDRAIWNEGPVNSVSHPVDQFWAERFLVYPNDSSTGPRKAHSSSASSKPPKSATNIDNKRDSHKPYYTTEPVTGSYIPYGGGLKICKGRFYAKQEALGSMALFLTMFDVEIVQEKGKGGPQPNMKYFPFGVVPPLGPIRAAIRRRKVEKYR